MCASRPSCFPNLPSYYYYYTPIQATVGSGASQQRLPNAVSYFQQPRLTFSNECIILALTISMRFKAKLNRLLFDEPSRDGCCASVVKYQIFVSLLACASQGIAIIKDIFKCAPAGGGALY